MKHSLAKNCGGALLIGLSLAGCATVEEQVAEAVAETRRADLTGANVVGSAGDPDGTARAELTVSDELDQICYDVNDIRNLSQITEIAIHRGGVGVNGPVMLRLRQPNEGGWKNCVGRSEWLEDRIERNPSKLHIVIHTTDYPKGAIRGNFSAN